MMQIRPVSDLRNKYTEIEDCVKSGKPVYLTKNGYGTMVVMSLEAYSRLTDPIEQALDEADRVAEIDERRMSHEEVFGEAKEIGQLQVKKADRVTPLQPKIGIQYKFENDKISLRYVAAISSLGRYCK